MENPKTGGSKQQLHIGKPKWLKTEIPTGSQYFRAKRELRSKGLYTVCEEAKCPNIGECWADFTATFMILGDTCTRACRFCNVKTGNPEGWLDQEEPEKTAESVRIMDLAYAVITMVDRDDLADFGADHVVKVLQAVKVVSPKTKLEFLGGDFAGQKEPLQYLIDNGGLHVFAHNLETVERLTPRVRDARAGYRQSLEVLGRAKRMANPSLLTKSALMLGLGEEEAEVYQVMKDLRDHEVDILTIGQYMRPTKRHLSIKDYIHPDQFAAYGEAALEMGFKAVASGPLVRSSYKAHKFFEEAQSRIAAGADVEQS